MLYLHLISVICDKPLEHQKLRHCQIAELESPEILSSHHSRAVIRPTGVTMLFSSVCTKSLTWMYWYPC